MDNETTDFKEFKNRSYLGISATTQDKQKLEEKLGIRQILSNLSVRTSVNASRRGAKNGCRVDIIRAMVPGLDAYCIGIVTNVSTFDDDESSYALYLCPTRASLEELKADFTKISKDAGLEDADDNFELNSIFDETVKKYYQ